MQLFNKIIPALYQNVNKDKTLRNALSRHFFVGEGGHALISNEIIPYLGDIAEAIAKKQVPDILDIEPGVVFSYFRIKGDEAEKVGDIAFSGDSQILKKLEEDIEKYPKTLSLMGVRVAEYYGGKNIIIMSKKTVEKNRQDATTPPFVLAGSTSEACQKVIREWDEILGEEDKALLRVFRKSVEKRLTEFLKYEMRAAAVTYEPWTPETVFIRGGIYYINTHTPPTHIQKEKVETTIAPEAFVDVVEKNFPHIFALTSNVVGGEGRETRRRLAFFFARLAFIAKARRKVKTSIIFFGPQGAGKNMLVEEVVRPVVGDGNFLIGTKEQFTSRFNAAIVGKLYVLANEVITNTYKDAMEAGVTQKIKTLITEDTINLELKGKDVIVMPNHATIDFASNSDRPLQIDADDRRFTVFKSSAPLFSYLKYKGIVKEGEAKTKALKRFRDTVKEEAEGFIRALYRVILPDGIDHATLPTEEKTGIVVKTNTKADILRKAIAAPEVPLKTAVDAAFSILNEEEDKTAALIFNVCRHRCITKINIRHLEGEKANARRFDVFGQRERVSVERADGKRERHFIYFDDKTGLPIAAAFEADAEGEAFFIAVRRQSDNGRGIVYQEVEVPRRDFVDSVIERGDYHDERFYSDARSMEEVIEEIEALYPPLAKVADRSAVVAMVTKLQTGDKKRGEATIKVADAEALPWAVWLSKLLGAPLSVPGIEGEGGVSYLKEIEGAITVTGGGRSSGLPSSSWIAPLRSLLLSAALPSALIEEEGEDIPI